MVIEVLTSYTYITYVRFIQTNYDHYNMMKNIVIEGDVAAKRNIGHLYTQTSKSNLPTPCEEEEEFVFR